jgi:hypothetical protein
MGIIETGRAQHRTERERQQEKEEEYEKWKRKGKICDRIGWMDRDNKNKKRI